MTTYLLRLNLDIKEKNFKDQLRFKLAASTIRSISKKTNKVVILSHLGRPAFVPDVAKALTGKKTSTGKAKKLDKSLSLRKFAPALSKTVRKRIKFIPHFNFPKIEKEIKDSPPGSIFLLENLRFLSGEVKNSSTLAKQLAKLGNRYINDDFATSHRAAASLVEITKFIPSKAGPTLRNEIKTLREIRSHPRHPFILVIGGAKMTEKIGVIKNLLPLAHQVLIGGGLANNFLKASGVNIGSSMHEPKVMTTVSLLRKNKKIIIPIDWRKENNKISDIGPRTIKLYTEAISTAKTIVWNGPVGYFEAKKFAMGTRKIARAIVKNKKARAVIGGGETVASLPWKIKQQHYGKIFISTGGGAMLEFLAGKNLPAIEALRVKRI